MGASPFNLEPNFHFHICLAPCIIGLLPSSIQEKVVGYVVEKIGTHYPSSWKARFVCRQKWVTNRIRNILRQGTRQPRGLVWGARLNFFGFWCSHQVPIKFSTCSHHVPNCTTVYPITFTQSLKLKLSQLIDGSQREALQSL